MEITLKITIVICLDVLQYIVRNDDGFELAISKVWENTTLVLNGFMDVALNSNPAWVYSGIGYYYGSYCFFIVWHCFSKHFPENGFGLAISKLWQNISLNVILASLYQQ